MKESRWSISCPRSENRSEKNSPASRSVRTVSPVDRANPIRASRIRSSRTARRWTRIETNAAYRHAGGFSVSIAPSSAWVWTTSATTRSSPGGSICGGAEGGGETASISAAPSVPYTPRISPRDAQRCCSSARARTSSVRRRRLSTCPRTRGYSARPPKNSPVATTRAATGPSRYAHRISTTPTAEPSPAARNQRCPPIVMSRMLRAGSDIRSARTGAATGCGRGRWPRSAIP